MQLLIEPQTICVTCLCAAFDWRVRLPMLINWRSIVRIYSEVRFAELEPCQVATK
jgi:hypothetical protein